jgi:hypothetical protein
VTLIGACVLLAILIWSVIYLSRQRLQQKLPVCDAQRMCPHCGRITARAQAVCLECGKEPML